MDATTLIRLQRQMCWERVKGELEAMSKTYWYEGTDHSIGQYHQMHMAFKSFVEEVESKGLQE